MSLNSKLPTVLSVVFIFATTGAISVSAQTQTAADSYPTSSILRSDSTTQAKKVEAAQPSIAYAENTAKDTPAEVKGEKDPNVIRGASAPVNTTELRSETVTAPRPQPAPTDKWQFQATPYFWLESLHGTGGVGNRTAAVDMSFGDIFSTLNFFIMGTFEARKGRFFSLTDVEYASISDDKATPGPLFSTVDAGFKTFIFDQEVGYRLYDESYVSWLERRHVTAVLRREHGRSNLSAIVSTT